MNEFGRMSSFIHKKEAHIELTICASVCATVYAQRTTIIICDATTNATSCLLGNLGAPGFEPGTKAL